jgi:hypothetical protein
VTRADELNGPSDGMLERGLYGEKYLVVWVSKFLVSGYRPKFHRLFAWVALVKSLGGYLILA